MALTILIGRPGSGKSTFCKTLDKEKRILLDDVLRQAKDQTILDYMESGILLPPEISIKALKTVVRCDDKSEKVLDGFPRNIEHAKLLEKENYIVSKVIFFDISEEICYQRLRNRGRFDGFNHLIPRHYLY